MNNAPAVYLEQSLAPEPPPSTLMRPIEPRILLVVMLQAAAVAFVAVVAFTHQTPIARRPLDPLFLAAVGISLAQCSLGGIWWAQSRWPLHLKTAIGVVACAAACTLLLAVLDESRGKADRAAGWAAAFASQFVLTALLAGALQWTLDFRHGQHQRRFTIMSLLLWTTLVACLLAAGRGLAAGFGWNATNFFSWTYFRHLQVIALMNATLAIGIFAAFRLTTASHGRIAACATLLLSITPATILMMGAVVGGNLGASVGDIALLSIIHAAFFTLTLGLAQPATQSQ